MNSDQFKEGLERLIFGKSEYRVMEAVNIMQHFEAMYYRKHRKDYCAAFNQSKMASYDIQEDKVLDRYIRMLEYQNVEKNRD